MWTQLIANVCLKIHHLLSQSLYALVATRLPYSSSILTLFQRQIGIECGCFSLIERLFLGRFALDQRRLSNATVCLVQNWKFPASGIKILHNLRDYIVWCNFSALDDLQQREKKKSPRILLWFPLFCRFFWNAFSIWLDFA